MLKEQLNKLKRDNNTTFMPVVDVEPILDKCHCCGWAFHLKDGKILTIYFDRGYFITADVNYILSLKGEIIMDVNYNKLGIISGLYWANLVGIKTPQQVVLITTENKMIELKCCSDSILNVVLHHAPENGRYY